jgi:hypothetical protein
VNLDLQQATLGAETNQALKSAVIQPSLLLSPFLPFDHQQ